MRSAPALYDAIAFFFSVSRLQDSTEVPIFAFTLTFRDLTFELKGLDRFIAVRHDASTIFTCFLEYEKDHVKVHDIIYEQKNNQWELKKSFFKKIRIFPQWTREILIESGFEIETYDIHNAAVCIIAHKT